MITNSNKNVLIAASVAGLSLAAVYSVSLYMLMKLTFTREGVKIKGAGKKVAECFEPFRAELKKSAAELDAYPSEEVYITSKDGLRLRARYFSAPRACRTIVMMHGYRGSGGNAFGKQFKLLLNERCNLLIVDERAHGGSDGDIITFGVREKDDCLLWARFAYEKSKLPVYLYGVSMGGAVVLLAGEEEEVYRMPGLLGIISDCGYSDVKGLFENMLRKYLGLPTFPFYKPVKLLCRLFNGFNLDEANPIVHADNIIHPVLLIHGSADSIVSQEMQKRLAEKIPDVSCLVVDGAEHIGSCVKEPKVYIEKILSFFDETEPL